MNEKIERLRKAAQMAIEADSTHGSALSYHLAWNELEKAMTPELLLAIIDQATDCQDPITKPIAASALTAEMRLKIEKLREVVMRVDALKAEGGHEYDFAWDEFDQIVRPDVVLALLQYLNPELEPEVVYKTDSAGFYALIYRGSSEILRIEYAENQAEAESILHEDVGQAKKRLTVVERVSVRRYVGNAG